MPDVMKEFVRLEGLGQNRELVTAVPGLFQQFIALGVPGHQEDTAVRREGTGGNGSIYPGDFAEHDVAQENVGREGAEYGESIRRTVTSGRHESGQP